MTFYYKSLIISLFFFTVFLQPHVLGANISENNTNANLLHSSYNEVINNDFILVNDSEELNNHRSLIETLHSLIFLNFVIDRYPQNINHYLVMYNESFCKDKALTIVRINHFKGALI